MHPRNPKNDQNAQIADEAADWIVTLSDPDPDDWSADPSEIQQAFLEWIRRSPTHLREFLELYQIHHRLHRVDTDKCIDVQKLLEGYEQQRYRRQAAFEAKQRTKERAGLLRVPSYEDSTTWPHKEVALAARPPARRSQGRILRPSGSHFIGHVPRYSAGSYDAQHNPRNRTRVFQLRSLWAASVITVILCALYLANLDWPREYRTAIGQQKTIHLWDSSEIILNTKSRLLVRTVRNSFQIQLLEGEAVFTIPHNPSRTVTVIAKQAIVKDVGTQFSVRIDGDRTVVSVASGTVLLSATQSPEAVSESAHKEPGAETPIVDIPLRGGERATFSGSGAEIGLREERILVPQLVRDWAWRQGWILLSDVPLELAVAEFNRYNQTQVIVSDPAISSKRFDISVPTTDLNSFVDSLAMHGVEAREGSAPGTIVLMGKRRTNRERANPNAPQRLIGQQQ